MGESRWGSGELATRIICVANECQNYGQHEQASDLYALGNEVAAAYSELELCREQIESYRRALLWERSEHERLTKQARSEYDLFEAAAKAEIKDLKAKYAEAYRLYIGYRDKVNSALRSLGARNWR